MTTCTGNVEILLVEDSPADARLTQEAFRDGKLRNTLNVVTDGAQALAYLKRELPYANAVRPDLILLDLNLPKIDGREVLRRVKSDPQLASIPVVVLTTSETDEDIARAYQYHANCYVRKPMDLDSFLNVVAAIETFWLTAVKLPPHGA
jgi:two-component system, chemotaxis family, response regulator Rcp1